MPIALKNFTKKKEIQKFIKQPTRKILNYYCPVQIDYLTWQLSYKLKRINKK